MFTNEMHSCLIKMSWYFHIFRAPCSTKNSVQFFGPCFCHNSISSTLKTGSLYLSYSSNANIIIISKLVLRRNLSKGLHQCYYSSIEHKTELVLFFSFLPTSFLFCWSVECLLAFMHTYMQLAIHSHAYLLIFFFSFYFPF